MWNHSTAPEKTVDAHQVECVAVAVAVAAPLTTYRNYDFQRSLIQFINEIIKWKKGQENGTIYCLLISSENKHWWNFRLVFGSHSFDRSFVMLDKFHITYFIYYNFFSTHLTSSSKRRKKVNNKHINLSFDGTEKKFKKNTPRFSNLNWFAAQFGWNAWCPSNGEIVTWYHHRHSDRILEWVFGGAGGPKNWYMLDKATFVRQTFEMTYV